MKLNKGYIKIFTYIIRKQKINTVRVLTMESFLTDYPLYNKRCNK